MKRAGPAKGPEGGYFCRSAKTTGHSTGDITMKRQEDNARSAFTKYELLVLYDEVK